MIYTYRSYTNHLVKCPQAKKKVAEKGWQNVHVVEADACTFTPPGETATLVTFSYSLSPPSNVSNYSYPGLTSITYQAIFFNIASPSLGSIGGTYYF
jgi:hypothetical protein